MVGITQETHYTFQIPKEIYIQDWEVVKKYMKGVLFEMGYFNNKKQ